MSLYHKMVSTCYTKFVPTQTYVFLSEFSIFPFQSNFCIQEYIYCDITSGQHIRSSLVKSGKKLGIKTSEISMIPVLHEKHFDTEIDLLAYRFGETDFDFILP